MSSNRRQIVKAWVLILQLGIGVLVPIILCVALGCFLDSYYGIQVTIPLLVLGVLAGVNSAWHLVKGFIGEESEETRLLTGIYDKAGGDTDRQEEEEDYLLEEYQENNRQREK